MLVSPGGQAGSGPPEGLQALKLSSRSKEGIETGGMLDDNAVEWAVNMFLTASKHTRRTAERWRSKVKIQPRTPYNTWQWP